MLLDGHKEAAREEKGLSVYGGNFALKTRCLAIKATVRAYMDTKYYDSNTSAFQNAGIHVIKTSTGAELKLDPNVVLLKTGPPEQVLTPLTPPRRKAHQSAVINSPRTISILADCKLNKNTKGVANGFTTYMRSIGDNQTCQGTKSTLNKAAGKLPWADSPLLMPKTISVQLPPRVNITPISEQKQLYLDLVNRARDDAKEEQMIKRAEKGKKELNDIEDGAQEGVELLKNASKKKPVKTKVKPVKKGKVCPKATPKRRGKQ